MKAFLRKEEGFFIFYRSNEPSHAKTKKSTRLVIASLPLKDK